MAQSGPGVDRKADLQRTEIIESSSAATVFASGAGDENRTRIGSPLYRVLGQTHPKVVSEQGENYRRSLMSLVDALGLKGDVQIDGRYRGFAELAAEVAAADLILLPYDSRDQATSGVLVEAVAAGKLVIATRFPHSIELLSQGGGVLVARESARTNSWGAVAESYQSLASDLARVSVAW